MTTRIGMPPAQGLYDPANEHDNCGVGFIANIKGRKSHSIVKRGIEILCNLTHRGAVGADPLDGDGAGLMIQMPDAFYRETCDFTLPKPGEYGAGIVFLPQDSACREACIAELDRELTRVGCQLLGWREIRTDSSTIGRNARAVEPRVMQVFAGRSGIEPQSSQEPRRWFRLCGRFRRKIQLDLAVVAQGLQDATLGHELQRSVLGSVGLGPERVG